MSSEPVLLTVRAGACPCPGTPHAVEQIYLEPELSLPLAAAGMASLTGTATVADVEAQLVEAFLPRAIRSWSFLEYGEPDAEGQRPLQPVPISRANLDQLLPFDQGGYELIERIGELYMARFMRPLVARMSTFSQPTSMDESMSASPPSGLRHPAPSRRSSRTNGAGSASEGRAR